MAFAGLGSDSEEHLSVALESVGVSVVPGAIQFEYPAEHQIARILSLRSLQNVVRHEHFGFEPELGKVFYFIFAALQELAVILVL